MAYNKYRNKKVTFKGMTFDSKKEFERYLYLRELEKEGKIYDLQTQVEFELLPKCRNGMREVSYRADFVYMIPGKLQRIVEDVKGVRRKKKKDGTWYTSPAYNLFVIKKKLMWHVHNIEVIEI